jgi:hypothetical protein
MKDSRKAGKLQDDIVQIVVDRVNLSGSVDFIGENDERFDSIEGSRRLDARPRHADLERNPDLPDDTRLWAALQNVSGGIWGGCVYDVEAILEKLKS